jgi:hypothetical protein
VRVDVDPLAANRLVESLGTSLRHGGEALEDVPKVLREVLETGAWREFVTRMGQRIQYERFEDFVTTPPLAGVGGSMDLVRRIASADPVTDSLLTDALGEGVRQGRRTDLNNNVQKVEAAPQGNARHRALRRLRKDRPDLHAEVLAGDRSAHAAMVEAGFRRRTITVPVEPHAAARIIRRHFDGDSFRELLNALSSPPDSENEP